MVWYNPAKRIPTPEEITEMPSPIMRRVGLRSIPTEEVLIDKEPMVKSKDEEKPKKAKSKKKEDI